MKVGIVGSGGREHALCYSLKKSKKVSKIYCFPGNAGTSKIAQNIDININDFEKIKNFIKKKQFRSYIDWSRKTFGRWDCRLFRKS